MLSVSINYLNQAMKTQDLLVNSTFYTSGCGCSSCCSSSIDYSAQDAQYDAQSYIRTSIANFSDAVVNTDSTTLPVLTQGEANAQLASQTERMSLVTPERNAPATQSSTMVREASAPVAAVQGESAIAFTDVAQSAGLDLPTQTWGSSIGDYDGDGYMDVWLTRHQQNAILYRNKGDGTFENVTASVFQSGETRGDFHGAAFIDINNDGTQDLLQSAGGDQGAADDNPNKAKKLFINTNGQFEDQATELGVEYLTGRGRINTIADFNNDGWLDYFFTGPPRNDGTSPPTLFLQQPDGTFQNKGPSGVDTNVPSGTFGIVSDLTGDGKSELIYAANSPRLQIYETSSPSANEVTFSDITADLLPQGGNATVQDVVVGDFNGDTRQDLFIVRQGSSTSGVRQDSRRTGRARLLITKSMQRGIELETAGNLSLNFQGDPNISLPQFMRGVGITPEEIKIGASGRSPDSLVFNLNTRRDSGLPDYEPGTDAGVFIGYEEGRWKILLSNNRFDEVNFLYRSRQLIENITAVNFQAAPQRRQSTLLINTGNGFEDRTLGSGLEDAITASNAVSGDFDNDGDLDIYVVATDLTSNQANILYENQGDGTFARLGDAGGASGLPTNGGPIKGIGDGASVTDYDNDGDLDLYVTNGDVSGFRRPFLIDGSPNLFQNNQTTGNHWVLLNLEGSESNRDAIGASVEIRAGGQTQVREQNGGIHNRSQNDKRLHFGLGQNTSINRIKIRWPSGRQEIIRNVGVDQIYTIVEGSGRAVVTNPGGGNNPPTPQVINGTSGDDQLVGGAGRDIIRGRAGRDSINALGGNDNVLGGKGDDVLNGSAGRDLLVGGQGRDVLRGGGGQDKFLFNAPQDADRVTDFKPGEDMIRLSVNQFGGGLTPGRLNSNQFHLGATATQGRHRVIYNPTTGVLLFDSDGSGSAAASVIASLDEAPRMGVNNIQLV